MIDQFKAIPSNASPKRLVKKYLEFCWSLPYYGRSQNTNIANLDFTHVREDLHQQNGGDLDIKIAVNDNLKVV